MTLEATRLRNMRTDELLNYVDRTSHPEVKELADRLASYFAAVGEKELFEFDDEGGHF